MEAIIKATEQQLIDQQIYPEFGYKNGDKVEVIRKMTFFSTIRKPNEAGQVISNDNLEFLPIREDIEKLKEDFKSIKTGVTIIDEEKRKGK